MGGFFSISDSSPVKQLEKVGKSIRNGVGKIIKRDASKELDNSLQPRVRKNNSLGKFKNTSNLEISKPLKNLHNNPNISKNMNKNLYNHSVNRSFESNNPNISKNMNKNNNKSKTQTQIDSNNNFNFLRQNLGSIEPKINRNGNNLTLKRINNKISESPRFS
jgi:hypothetical protein